MSTALIPLGKGKKALVSFGAIFGRKAVVVIAGLINLVCGVGIASGVTADTVQKGVNGVFLTAGIVTIVGVVIVLTKIRPMLSKEE